MVRNRTFQDWKVRKEHQQGSVMSMSLECQGCDEVCLGQSRLVGRWGWITIEPLALIAMLGHLESWSGVWVVKRMTSQDSKKER